MPPSHPTTAPRAGVSLLASALLLGSVLGVLLLTPVPLPSDLERAGGLRLLVLLTGLAGLAVGGAMGWTLAVENARLRTQVQDAFELVGVAAHDLGNPLMSLQLRLHGLRAHVRPDAPAQEGLARVEREAHRLGLLVHDLLDLSRQSAGRLSLAPEEVDLGELLREVAGRFDEQAAATGSTLEVHAPHAVHGRWDRRRLDRVATNLISNALKFGRGQPVEVHVLADGPRARLAVKDNGVGLSAEAQGRLFGRFERPGDSAQPGNGLGLYIVRQLVEAHGGTLHVSSRPGRGSTFTVELPRSPP